MMLSKTRKRRSGLAHRTVIIAFDELDVVEKPSKSKEIRNDCVSPKVLRVFRLIVVGVMHGI